MLCISIKMVRKSPTNKGRQTWLVRSSSYSKIMSQIIRRIESDGGFTWRKTSTISRLQFFVSRLDELDKKWKQSKIQQLSANLHCRKSPWMCSAAGLRNIYYLCKEKLGNTLLEGIFISESDTTLWPTVTWHTNKHVISIMSMSQRCHWASFG